MSGQTVFDQNGKQVRLGQRIGGGGEGTVYALSDFPDFCGKIFPIDRALQRREKIVAMLQSPPTDPTWHTLKHHSIAWPVTACYHDASRTQFCGYIMPMLDATRFKELHYIFAYGDRNSAFGSGMTWKHLLTTAANLSSAVAAVHSRRHRIGDLRESNIMVSRDALVTLIDCDSFQVHNPSGRQFMTSVLTPGCVPPEMLKPGIDLSCFDRTFSDYYALALLIFRLLMDGNQPYAAVGKKVDQANDIDAKVMLGYFAYAGKTRGLKPPPLAPEFDALPASIRKLFVECFTDGHKDPMRRPSPEKWHRALLAELSLLNTCSRNPGHAYSRECRSCPWCEYASAHGVDLFPQALGGQISLQEPAASAPLAQRQAYLLQVLSPLLLGGSLTPAQHAHVLDLGLRLSIPAKVTNQIIQQGLKGSGATSSGSKRSGANSTSAAVGTPRLDVSPTAIHALQLPPGTTAQTRIEIRNVGGGILSGTLATGEKWITLSQSIIDESVHQQTVLVTVNARQLPEGFARTGVIYINTNGGTIRIPVNIQVLVASHLMGRFKMEAAMVGSLAGGTLGYGLYHMAAKSGDAHSLNSVLAYVAVPAAILGTCFRIARPFFRARQRLKGLRWMVGGLILSLFVGSSTLNSLPTPQWTIIYSALAGLWLMWFAADTGKLKFKARRKLKFLAVVLAAAAIGLLWADGRANTNPNWTLPSVAGIAAPSQMQGKIQRQDGTAFFQLNLGYNGLNCGGSLLVRVQGEADNTTNIQGVYDPVDRTLQLHDSGNRLSLGLTVAPDGRSITGAIADGRATANLNGSIQRIVQVSR